MRTMTILLAAAFLVGAHQRGAAQEKAKDYPKLSPFSAVRWKDSTPEVKVKDTWYELLAINDTEAKDIVKFCKDEEERLWQKRFEEDLVEMMARMGHEPGEKVTLKVRELEGGKTTTLKDVPNTHENRQAIWRARHEGK
jgi:ribosomal protein S3AE